MKTQSYAATEFAVMRWAQDRGIYTHGTALGQAEKTLEEAQELIDAIKIGSKPQASDAIGDVLVTLVNCAALLDLDVRQCFYEAYQEIKDRKGQMKADGKFHKEA